MATRFYLRASSETTPISPSPDAGWEDTGSVARAIARTGNLTSDAMATISFTDANNTDRDCILRQYISLPLVAGQTITGSQALKAQVRISERIAGNNLFLTIGIRVIAANGSTVQKTVLAVTRDGVEAVAGTLTNRQFTATSAATNYTTVAGDRLVIEVGAGGDPANTGGADHDFDLRLGDAAASDMAEDDSSTADNKPWVELTNTLTFVGELTGTCDNLFDDGSSTLVGSGALAASLPMVFDDGSSTLLGSGALASSLPIVFANEGNLVNNPGTPGGVTSLLAFWLGGGSAPAADEDLAGIATITFTGSATLTGAGALLGTTDLVFDDGSTILSGAGALLGTSDLVFDDGTSTLTGSGALLGTSAVVFTESGTVLGAGTLLGTAAITFDDGTSVLLGAGVLLGTSTLLFDDGTSTITGAGVLLGSCAVVFLNAGAGQIGLLGTTTLVFSTSLESNPGATFGSSEITVTPTGTILGAGLLTGTSTNIFTGSGLIVGHAPILGSLDIACTPTGTLGGSGVLTGTITLDLLNTASTLVGTGGLFATTTIQFAENALLTDRGISGEALLQFDHGNSTLLGSTSLTGIIEIVSTMSGTAIVINFVSPIIVDATLDFDFEITTQLDFDFEISSILDFTYTETHTIEF